MSKNPDRKRAAQFKALRRAFVRRAPRMPSNYADRPKSDDNTLGIIEHFTRMGLIRYPDCVSAVAAAEFIRRDDETLDAAYARIVHGIETGELQHLMIGSTGEAETELPLLRWQWVDEWQGQ